MHSSGQFHSAELKWNHPILPNGFDQWKKGKKYQISGGMDVPKTLSDTSVYHDKFASTI